MLKRVAIFLSIISFSCKKDYKEPVSPSQDQSVHSFPVAITYSSQNISTYFRWNAGGKDFLNTEKTFTIAINSSDLESARFSFGSYETVDISTRVTEERPTLKVSNVVIDSFRKELHSDNSSSQGSKNYCIHFTEPALQEFPK